MLGQAGFGPSTSLKLFRGFRGVGLRDDLGIMLGIYRLYAGQIRLLAFWPHSLKNWHVALGGSEWWHGIGFRLGCSRVLLIE